MRRLTLAACLVAVLAGCGGDGLTLAEYGAEVEGLTTAMYRKLNAVTIEENRLPTVEAVRTTYDGVAEAYNELPVGLRGLDPPGDAEELHATSLDIVSRLAATHDAVALRARELQTEDELIPFFESEEAQAAVAAQEEIVAFCQGVQAQFYATADRAVFEDVPWIPSELQEVIEVAFGCDEGT